MIFAKLSTKLCILEYSINFWNLKSLSIWLNGSKSSSHIILCQSQWDDKRFWDISNGVPQGATLSPLLFSIFINDIPKPDKRFCNFSLLFADDLGCAFSFKKPGNISKIINSYLEILNDWFVKWRLNLNINKCSYTVFAKGSKNEGKLGLKINRKNIPYQ